MRDCFDATNLTFTPFDFNHIDEIEALMDRRQFLNVAARTVPALTVGNVVWRDGYAQSLSRSGQPCYTYDPFVKAMPLLRSFWYQPAWLYHNLDNRRFDEWALEQFAEKRQELEAHAVGFFENDSKEAARRKIPAVCDEGGYFWPPLGSQFELTEPGMSLFDLQTDLAIEHGYWGMMPTTYCGPEMPLWDNVQWLQAINGRFQAGTILET